MIIYGLPIQSWALILLSIGLGLGIELLFYLRHRPKPPQDSPETDHSQ